MTGQRYYAGIGSQETPPETLKAMRAAAARLRERGFILRSGGARGADTAFAEGAAGHAEIYLPWPEFNGNPSPRAYPTTQAFELTSDYHPDWAQMGERARMFMARNAHQVLGDDLNTPSAFVLCWTPDGAETHGERSRATGGTGQAISIAHAHDIPVFNMRHDDALDRLAEWLQENDQRKREDDR